MSSSVDESDYFVCACTRIHTYTYVRNVGVNVYVYVCVYLFLFISPRLIPHSEKYETKMSEISPASHGDEGEKNTASENTPLQVCHRLQLLSHSHILTFFSPLLASLSPRALSLLLIDTALFPCLLLTPRIFSPSIPALSRHFSSVRSFGSLSFSLLL